MNVLGLNLLRPNASAALFAGGKLVAAIEEERFSRVKFSAGIPFASIRFCLDRAGLSMEDIDVITFPRSPNIKLCDHDRIHFQERIYRVTSQLDRYRTDLRLIQLRQVLAQELGSSPDRLSFTLTEQDHHRSHILSGLYASSFEKALVVSCDAFGDYVSLKAGVAEGNRLAMNRQVELPHSLGLFYTAITQFLGFRNYGDEAKVMGLSTFGEPEFQDELRKLISWDRSGHQLDLTYFEHENGVGTAWSKSSPDITWLGSSRIAELIGPIREPGGELTAVHKNIAASLQLVTEQILCSMIEDLYEEYRIPNLVLTGGLAYNSLLCSRIASRTSIEKVFVPPAPGNSG
ncbi:MAG TPA: carbamoyltransferase N-terminal domain-containing protein, partial [Acidobacteriota bacterium]|nr:carbamoyltransferase N-terminal domain-containing protein [Acidobacteriota bacterium]